MTVTLNGSNTQCTLQCAASEGSRADATVTFTGDFGLKWALIA